MPRETSALPAVACVAIIFSLSAGVAMGQSFFDIDMNAAYNPQRDEIVTAQSRSIYVYDADNLAAPKSIIETPWQIMGVSESRGDLIAIEHCFEGETCDYGNPNIIDFSGETAFSPTPQMRDAGYRIPYHGCSLLGTGDGFCCSDLTNSGVREAFGIPDDFGNWSRIWFTVQLSSGFQMVNVTRSKQLAMEGNPGLESSAGTNQVVADVKCLGSKDCLMALADGTFMRVKDSEVLWSTSKPGKNGSSTILGFDIDRNRFAATDKLGNFFIVNSSTGEIEIFMAPGKQRAMLMGLFARGRGADWLDKEVDARLAQNPNRSRVKEEAAILRVGGGQFLPDGKMLISGSGKWVAIFDPETGKIVGREFRDHIVATHGKKAEENLRLKQDGRAAVVNIRDDGVWKFAVRRPDGGFVKIARP